MPQRRGSFFHSLSLTEVIIGINIVCFVLFYTASIWMGERLTQLLALNPALFTSGYFWTPLTSMFLHAGLGHLFMNMVSLFFIGNFVERLIGRKRFLWFYLISGIVAGLAFVAFSYIGLGFSWGALLFGSPSDFAVGASGALFGLGGLLAVLIPRLKVLVFFVIPMPMWLAMAVLMFGLWAISASAGLGVGNTAHFGGLLVGLIYGFYLRTKYAHKVRMLGRIFR